MPYKLNIPYDELINKLTFLENQASEFETKNQKTYSSDEIDLYFQNWQKDVIKCFEESISPQINIFIDPFIYSNRYSFLSNEKADLYELTSKISELKEIKVYLKTIDSFQNSGFIRIESTQDKIDFILLKLNSINNGNFYSVSTILKINEIEFREGEAKEIAENIVKRGYASRQNQYNDDDNIRISIKGSLYIEKKQNGFKAKQKKITESELNSLLNAIIKKVDKLGLGQEVLFEELEELRSLIGKINKKNWIQLLKGKIIDLALGEIISKETFTYILETISDMKLKLPK